MTRPATLEDAESAHTPPVAGNPSTNTSRSWGARDSGTRGVCLVDLVRQDATTIAPEYVLTGDGLQRLP